MRLGCTILDVASVADAVAFYAGAFGFEYGMLAVAAGTVAVKTPERKPWGQLAGHVRDNNGFLAETCPSMEA